MPAFPSQRPGFQQAGLDIPFVDIVPQGRGAGATQLMSPFIPSCQGASARAQPFVAANPMTGKLTWFKPAGRPILWSGDLSAAKRVRKVAARARRSSGKR